MRKVRESKLGTFKRYVLQRIQEGTTKCMVLFEEIQAMGYEGKATLRREFVNPLSGSAEKTSYSKI